jgi:hypothetical protein
MSTPPAHLLARQQSQFAPPPDKMERLRAAVRRLRDLMREREDLTQRTREVGKQILALTQKDLVDLMDEAQVDQLGLPAEGNLPAYDASLEPYCKAVISAEWSEDRREKAFRVLEDMGLGELISNVFTVTLPRGAQDEANALAALLDQAGVEYDREMAVPWNTLTAALNRLRQSGQLPAQDKLEAMGAAVGRYVNLKPRKKEN